MPVELVVDILKRTQALCSAEPTLVEIAPGPTETVTVVGDTHGQFHDVLRMLEVAGSPSDDRLYIINGDMVDRGSWGLETLLTFCLLKLARAAAAKHATTQAMATRGNETISSYSSHTRRPPGVTLLRGNHETATCSVMYGFKQELEAKYGKSAGKTVFSACKQLFKNLPLAALVNNRTLVLHGGLFRKHPSKKKRVPKNKAKGKKRSLYEDDEDFKLDESDDPELGSLNDLRSGSKGGLDATGLGDSRLAADVLWSDPGPDGQPGFEENYARGIGMVFGSDVTEEFLRKNGLKLIIRSHEGPDARESRPEMPNMLEGFTTDHETASGKLMTVFSAPDYPQHLPEDMDRYGNKAAVFVLSAKTEFASPEIKQWEAVLPRPEVCPYYDLGMPDSDEEIELLPATASGMTDVSEISADDTELAGEVGTATFEEGMEQRERGLPMEVAAVAVAPDPQSRQE